MHVKNKQPLPAVTLAAIGVVYGDIGTSPLYTLRECLTAEEGIRAGYKIGRAHV